MATPSAKQTVSLKLQRIAALAKEDPNRVLTGLSHHIDEEFLNEAYRRTRKDGATGVDGQTAAHYERDLRENLRNLLNEFKSGRYFAPPVRRTYVPKEKGKRRPLGIPTFEDKVLQQAVTMVLTAVYEQNFLDCSYGYRPGRSAHQALHTLREGIHSMGGGWVLDLDIQAFFEHLNHQKLRETLDQRVRDGVLRKMIDKWLKAGILEDGQIWHPAEGTPQGGVVSPLLANLYLHTVIDQWFEQEIRPRLRGRAFLIRFADDLVMVFAHEEDARRVLAVLPQRLGRFGLTLHPEKSRLVRFHPGSASRSHEEDDPDPPPPNTFDFLAFTHFWARSRKQHWVIKRKTAKGRLRRALATISRWCRKHRHWRFSAQHAALTLKVQGHYAYYGITGNSPSLSTYLWHVERIWKYWLCRRSQRGRRLNWERFTKRLARQPLPPPYIVHAV
jgi:group II intron reverse transcriptase/maturase